MNQKIWAGFIALLFIIFMVACSSEDSTNDLSKTVVVEEKTEVSVEIKTETKEAFSEATTEEQTTTIVETTTVEVTIEDITETIDDQEEEITNDEAHDFVLNTSKKRFHIPDYHCSNSIAPHNRLDYHGTVEEIIKLENKKTLKE